MLTSGTTAVLEQRRRGGGSGRSVTTKEGLLGGKYRSGLRRVLRGKKKGGQAGVGGNPGEVDTQKE